MDGARERSNEPFSMQVDDSEILRTIDRLAYQYFCLSPDEIALIDDTVEAILPALQPHEGHFPKLWEAPDEPQRAQYAHTLSASLADWFKGKKIDARLVARGADLAILRLQLGGHEDYAEDAAGELDRLAKDVVVRRLCHWVEYQFEPFGLAVDGSKYSKGIIDIAVLFDWNRERYLAYECKRLNVINGGSRSSLATVYVTQGMMRFLTEQYAEQLPVGCMLGYVLDGDVPFANSRIADAIGSHVPLALAEGPTPLAAIEMIERFRTRHTRQTGSQIELRHALFLKPSAVATNA